MKKRRLIKLKRLIKGHIVNWASTIYSVTQLEPKFEQIMSTTSNTCILFSKGQFYFSHKNNLEIRIGRDLEYCFVIASLSVLSSTTCQKCLLQFPPSSMWPRQPQRGNLARSAPSLWEHIPGAQAWLLYLCTIGHSLVS